MTRVYVSAVMPITLEQAWSVLRDFNGLPNYHPSLPGAKSRRASPPTRSAACAISTITTVMSSARSCSRLRSRTPLLLPHPRGASVAVRGYVAEMRLKPITTTDQCFGEWWAEFDVDDADRKEVMQRVSDTFRLAFEGTTERCARG
ncbi:SRPBCC family protein [Billgrantia gudaonensis]|uniref:SRPBCC family protein n=1 Tax=Billgrantia gudaonensis TaxID=376427 RepID=A0A3S0Q1H9_9GAMM|nr:SRPBCC family protein [Halomonas gudaonensis]